MRSGLEVTWGVCRPPGFSASGSVRRLVILPWHARNLDKPSQAVRLCVERRSEVGGNP